MREIYSEQATTISTASSQPNNYSNMRICNPPYSKRKHSNPYSSTNSSYNEIGKIHNRSMLGCNNQWVPSNGTTSANTEFIQFDLDYEREILGVVTQGRGDGHYQNEYHVTSYTVQACKTECFSNPILVDSGRIFEGNYDDNTKVVNLFNTPTRYRYLRIIPQSCKGYICMRTALVISPSAGSTFEWE